MATAQIDEIRVDHNLWLNNSKGMVIYVTFAVQGLAGQMGRTTAYFNYWQGEPLRDFDGAYRTQDGHVSVGLDFVPRFDATRFPDFQLFMPYKELHMASGSYELMFNVVIWDKSQTVPQSLASSSWIRFEFEVPALV